LSFLKSSLGTTLPIAEDRSNVFDIPGGIPRVKPLSFGYGASYASRLSPSSESSPLYTSLIGFRNPNFALFFTV